MFPRRLVAYIAMSLKKNFPDILIHTILVTAAQFVATYWISHSIVPLQYVYISHSQNRVYTTVKNLVITNIYDSSIAGVRSPRGWFQWL